MFRIYYAILQKSCLFFSHKDPDGYTRKIEMFAQLVFKIPFVGFSDILRKVTVKCK